MDYTADDLRRQAKALELLRQPDTAAMLRAGADALQRVVELTLDIDELKMEIDLLQTDLQEEGERD